MKRNLLVTPIASIIFLLLAVSVVLATPIFDTNFAVTEAATPLTIWQQVFPAFEPTARDFGALAYDSARGVTVLFGGRVNGQYNFLGDTWEWDGTNWVQRNPLHSPSARASHAVAYDSIRQRTVMFGGFDGGWSNATWEWDGNDWSVIPAAVSPSGRTSHAMAYDSDRGVVVLFGGFGAYPFNDTWEWDGTNWYKKTPSISPPARHRHKMVYDSIRQRVVLFGGSSSNGQLNDTWEWDGTNWVQRLPTQVPAPRGDHGMAFDIGRGKTVVFGGRLKAGTNLGDTWEWDGINWVETSPSISPEARIYPAMAYDSSRSEVGLFSGSNETGDLNDTWLYKEESIVVELDIKPGDFPNCINNDGHGVIPVAILGSDLFNVEEIDVASLIFSGLEVRIKGNGNQQCSIKEINGDIYPDLVCQFQDADGIWEAGDTEATVIGITLGGKAIIGTDSLCVVP